MILYQIPLLILTMGLVYIFIAPSEPYIFSLFFKLVPMFLILIYAFKRLPRKKSNIHWLLISGLIFGIVGHVTAHWFLVGLSAFFVGHLFYMAGFLSVWKFGKVRFAMILPISVYGFFMGNELLVALNTSGNEVLIIPIILYLIVTLLMLWSAIMTGNRWAILGSLLFVISDSILSLNIFIASVPNSEALIMSAYYAAQFFIIHSLGTIVGENKRIVW
ncbi:lysoplasmalogenase [Oceanobacillus saliphilus]|uniref:lysoplasmalogenase n=1 Tax=Oceanobacillus saliphilus TaxID=2925834 RepID=UPI00201DDF5C|nr:lysoplasmalogenase [Oceanobacillus saliphilus]